MSSYESDPSFDEKSGSNIWVQLFFLGLGFLFGWGIGRDRAWDDAVEWAVQTSKLCEVSYKADGDASVTDCLKGAIDKAEEERREELRAEDHDPRS